MLNTTEPANWEPASVSQLKLARTFRIRASILDAQCLLLEIDFLIIILKAKMGNWESSKQEATTNRLDCTSRSSGSLASGWSPGDTGEVKTMLAITGQPIKNLNSFDCPRASPGDQPLTKEPEDSGYETGCQLDLPQVVFLCAEKRDQRATKSRDFFSQAFSA